MIKRIELTNFMSHEHTVVELAEGLTVLVGPNNCGKSAVVAALQILAYNENSKYVLRHGEKECAVRVETDDGHVIEWRRKRESPRYAIDGELFDRLGRGGTPESLAKTLRLTKVGCGDRDTDVHFGDQKRPIFLLDASEQQAAQFFASSSDASRFVEMQSLHKQKAATALREKSRLESEAARLNHELQALEPLADLDEQLRALEQSHHELSDLALCLERQMDDLTRLRDRCLRRDRYSAECQVLAELQPPPVDSPVQALESTLTQLKSLRARKSYGEECSQSLTALHPPPALVDVEPLQQILRQLTRAVPGFRQAHAIAERLGPLRSPPLQQDVESLQALLSRFRTLEQAACKGALQQSSFASLQPPPSVDQASAAVVELQEMLVRLGNAAALVATCTQQVSVARQELSAAESRVRQWAAEGQVCRACGSSIDPDRLMEHIASRDGGCVDA